MFLWQYTDMNFTEISESVGFKTLSHFCAVFRRLLGYSPGQIRSMEAQINRLDLLEQKRFLEANREKYVPLPEDPAEK